MDYYENVVVHYLRADRALFVNTECCIQINEGDNPDVSGPHWYCDCVAVDFRDKAIWLCEVSYSKTLGSVSSKGGTGVGLAGRLRAWHENWPAVCHALIRDSFLPNDWPVQPWIFIPQHLKPTLNDILGRIYANSAPQFSPRITALEQVQPWKFPSWNRKYAEEG
jgi:hypothetical protein